MSAVAQPKRVDFIRSLIYQFGLILLLGGLAGHALADEWPTQQYKLKHGLNPFATRLSDEQVTKIEDLMQQYAVEYQRQGWRAPFHEMEDGAYVVYVRSIPTGHSARAANMCADPSRRTYIEIDPKVWNGNIGTKYEAKNWQDLAHEMFHTIQGSYSAFQSCPNNKGIGSWVHEGTAEAVGIYMARKIASVRPYTICQIGLRSYATKLHLPDGATDRDCNNNVQKSYQTSSFWTYLGEWKAKKAPPTPKQTTQPDFRYLQPIFETRPAKFTSQYEYIWLDQGLKKSSNLGFSLRKAYGRFVAAFSGYLPERAKFYRGGAPGV